MTLKSFWPLLLFASATSFCAPGPKVGGLQRTPDETAVLMAVEQLFQSMAAKDSEGVLFWGLLFGCVGSGFLVYGRKQRKIVPFVTRLALIFLPYFVASIFWLVAGGLVLLAIPYFIRE